MAREQPRWSLSGDQLAFVDISLENNSRQVYVLPMTGGEARRVSRATNGVDEFRWTSDGKSFLYTSAESPKQREGEERHNRSFDVADTSYLTRQARTPVHLWRIPVRDGEARRLSEGDVRISDLVVSPDGHSIAFSFDASLAPDSGRPDVIRTLDLASGESRDLVSGMWINASTYSPDGRFLAFVRPRQLCALN